MKQGQLIKCLSFFVLTAVVAAVSVVGFVISLLPLGIVFAVLAFFCLLLSVTSVYREITHNRLESCFQSGEFRRAKEILDGASHLLFFDRTFLKVNYIRVEFALDDLTNAVKNIDSLRHRGGSEWRFKTAYYVVLLNLDWDDVAGAREEYEALESVCAHTDIYKEELNTLRTVFACIDGREAELSKSLKNPVYPVLTRIMRKYC